jgi:taurine--2-oxoglutarate transaminase
MTTTYALDRRHVFHSWSAQAEISPLEIVAAEGSVVWDADGRSYLDFSSQLVFTNLGHQHPRVVAAIQEQAARLCTVAPAHANAARSEAASLIAERAPEGFEKVFFTNGGAKVLTAYRSYHGGTQTAINLTGDPRRFANDLGTSGVSRFFGPFLYRSEFSATNDAEECERALQHLRRTIEAEGPATIAAILLETVPGPRGSCRRPTATCPASASCATSTASS